ncbi:MAG: hypothetical protein ABII00_10460 [Elusimicrobiota bacterium]
MAVVAVVAADEKSRSELRLAVEELGHRAASASDLKAGLELLRSERPRAMLVAQDPSETVAESALVELEREAPLMPVVVALTKRDAPRALELLKAGAFEVIAPPWTPENLTACLSKALRFKGTAFEVMRPPETSKGVWFYFLMTLVLFTIAVGYATIERRRRLVRIAEMEAPPTQWELPYAHPAGLAFDGEEFWITDWFSQTLYRHARGGLRVVRTRHLPSEVPGAVAFAGDALWVAGAPAGLAKHMLDDRLTILERIKDEAARTVGMAYDGLYLWTCDNKKGRLHKRILDEELSVVASYGYPGSRPAALAFDGRGLWSLDAGNRELLRHDLAEPERVTLRLPLPEYGSGDWSPTGLAFDGERFWTVAEPRPGPSTGRHAGNAGKGAGAGRIFAHRVPEEVLRKILRP